MIPELDDPVVFVVTGHPGSGKTTVARHIASALRVPLLSKDAIKERLFETLGWSDDDLEWSHRLGGAAIAVLFRLAEDACSAGSSVVLESNFIPELARDDLLSLMARSRAAFVQVVLTADPAILLERCRVRAEAGERHPGHPDAHIDDPALAATFQRSMVIDLPGPRIDVDANDLDNLDLDDLARQVTAAVDRAST